MKTARLAAAFLGLLIGLAPLHAARTQTPADSSRVLIAGRVVDPVRHPIVGAEVLVLGKSLSTFTSDSGEFRLFIPRAALPLVLHVRRPGLQAQLLRVEGGWSGVIVLAPGAVTLPELRVTASAAKPLRFADTHKYDDVFRRRRIGLGSLIERPEIDRRGASRVPEMLEGRGGIRVQVRPLGAVEGTIVSFSRCNEFPPRINVYLDGMKLQPEQGPLQRVLSTVAPGRGVLVGEDPQTVEDRARVRAQVGEMLDRVSLAEVEFIEIFRGVAELPAEFNDGNCGAIAVWTRAGGRPPG